jgi:enoyl-CoA hydratase
MGRFSAFYEAINDRDRIGRFRMAGKAVLYKRHGKVGVITLNRPERLNAINGRLLRDFVQQLRKAREDKEAVSVVLTGAGRAFCAGEDLKETAEGKSFDTWVEETDGLQDIQRDIMRLGKPLIAAIRGYALGGGCEFALSCDIRVVSEDVKFGFPETEVGLTVTTAGTKLLSHIVGLGKAKELIFTGEFVGAEEALRMGLANRVVSGEKVLEEALAMAQRIAQRSPLALRLSRIAVDQGLGASIEEILELEASHLLICVSNRNQKQFLDNKLKKMKK